MVARQPSDMEDCARQQFHDCSRILIFQESLQMLFSTFQAPQAELKALAQSFADRENAIRKGLIFEGKRFEVHRYHPPLVYGRSLTGQPEQSEGAAVCKVEHGPGGMPAYAAITYPMPHVSARMVELLRVFCERELAQKV